MKTINELSNSIEFVTEDGIQLIGLSNLNESLSTHHIVYKIHNLVNGKHYIGQHMTDNPFDKYMGGGVLISNARSKYPLNSFIKEIMFDFDNFDDMNNKEYDLVPLSSCYPYDPMSYNLIEGGKEHRLYSIESRHKMSIARKGKAPANKGKKASKSLRIKISKARKGKCCGKDHPNYGKHRTLEQRQHHSKIMKGKMAKEKHPLWELIDQQKQNKNLVKQ